MRILCLLALTSLSLFLSACGGGGSEDPFERTAGTWSGTYTTPTLVFEIRMEVGADGEILSFTEIGGPVNTTGDVEHDGGAAYRLELATGRSIRVHFLASGDAFLMVYQVADEAFVGLMEKGAVDRPVGGFVAADLHSSGWLGNGARYDLQLDLTRAFGADLGFSATSAMSGTEGANGFGSAGSSAALDDATHGLWSSSVVGLYDDSTTGLYLMSPSKRFLFLGVCESGPMPPPTSTCHFMVLQRLGS